MRHQKVNISKSIKKKSECLQSKNSISKNFAIQIWDLFVTQDHYILQMVLNCLHLQNDFRVPMSTNLSALELLFFQSNH